MTDFIGLAANCSYSNLEKECFVFGMTRMRGSHNAENIKFAIEEIINNFEFNKLKINGKIYINIFLILKI